MADINDNTINITISAPSADSNTISVVNPALKNNVVVNDARITPSERAKLLDSVTLTGDQTISTGSPISGDKSFQGSDVEFVAGNFTFGTNGNLKVNGGIPEVNTANLYLKRSGNTIGLSSQSIVKNTGVNGSQFSLSNTVGPVILSSTGPSVDGEVTVLASNKVVNKAPSVDVKITAGDGTFNILASHASNVTDRKRFEFTEDSVFKVYAKSTDLSTNYQEVFEIKTNASNNGGLDYIRIGPQTVNEAYYDLPGSRGSQDQILQLNANNQLEFVDYSPISQRMQAESTSIDSLIDVDTSSVSPDLNEALIWDGNNFVPGAVSSSLNIGDLQDVDAPSPQVDYALVWTSNNKWEPRAQIDTDTDTNTTVLSTDATPTLGADLDVSTYSITTTESNGGITIRPDGNGALTLASASGTGNVIIGNQNTPSVRIGTLNIGSDQSVSASNDGNVLTYDSSSQKISLQPPVSTVTELDHLTDVNLSGGVSQGDVMQAEANGTFSPQNALQAFMSAAYLLADNANAPLPSGALGDFNGDGTVDADDLTLFLGMFGGSSVFDGNTNITFSDISPTDTVTGAQALINSSNYNTQTVTTFIDQLFLTTPSDSNSVDIYNWTVNTTSQTDHNVQFDTTGSVEMSDWFSTAKLYFQDPSEMVFDIAGFEDSTSFNFCLYLEVSRVYPSGTSNTTDLYPLSTYLSVPTVGTVNLNQNGQIVVDDVFSQNAESVMPRDVFLRFYVCPDPSSFEGSVFYSFSNLKLKVAS